MVLILVLTIAFPITTIIPLEKPLSFDAEEKQAMQNLLTAFIHNAREEPVTHRMEFHDPGFYDYLLDPNRPAYDPNTSIVKKET